MSILTNLVLLTGAAGKDPEVKYNPNGTVVANISMATDDSYKDKEGQWKQRTIWHQVCCWGELAKVVEKTIKKGTKLSIQGKLDNSSWEDSEGKKHYKTFVQLHEFKLLDPPKRNNDSYDEMGRM